MSTCLSRGCSYSPTDSESLEYTALQHACRKGSIEQVRYLIDSEIDLDLGPDPALHLALRKQHTGIALLLLQSGAEFEIKDSHGDYPIHIACALGLLDIVHTLCALGCNVEVATSKGLFPLHLAAKNGHINIVRCLCTAGCNIEIKNADSIRADITALKYGHNDIADLLDRLRGTGNRDLFARQLVPTSKPALRLSLRLLGNCAVGKSAFVKSLSAGLFSSLFRRSSSLQSNKSRPSSPINTQIEMDVTSRQNSLNFESTVNYQCTNGIHVQNVEISGGVGEVMVWDFSGQESYFPVYHHFLYPNPYAITCIMFSLEDSANVQVQQVLFWLNFLMARQLSDLPTYDYGKIILIATHVDTTRAAKNQQGEWISPDAQKTAETVCKMLPHTPSLSVSPIVMDCNVPASYAFKQLKSLLLTLKQDGMQGALLDNIFNKQGDGYDLLATPCFKQTIGTWTGLLEATLTWLSTTVQKQYEQYPVLARDNFANLLRTHVNLLTSDEHINELLQQLHSMGEVFCILDLVVISVPWLGSQLIGELLSTQFLMHARVTGVYTSEDFQASYNQCDALGVLELLKALDLCVRCKVDGDVEYEFPIYNQTETLPGLWDSGDPRYRTTGASYGGVRLYTPPQTCHLFSSLFPHIQVNLRKATLDCDGDVNDTDLYQWYGGSKLCTTTLESLITLNQNETGDEFVEVKIRGPRQSARSCFYFFEQILETVYQAVYKVCPGMLMERHVMSHQQLRVHHPDPHTYEPHVLMASMLEAESTLDIALPNTDNADKPESIVQLVLFDNVEIAGNIQWGCALKVSDLPAPVKLKLCGLLDPPDSHGRDWCLLALRLGLSQERIAALDSQHASCTMRLLTIADCSIGALIASMHELDRSDAAEVVLRSAPLLKIIEHVNV